MKRQCVCVCVCVCRWMNSLKGGSYSTSHKGSCNLLNLPDRKWIERSVEVGKGRGNNEKKSMAQLKEGKITDKRRKRNKKGNKDRKGVFKCGKRQLDIKRPVTLPLSLSVCVCMCVCVCPSVHRVEFHTTHLTHIPTCHQG